jgi:hypothetical protein
MFTGGETGNEGTPLSSLARPGPPGVGRGTHPAYLEGVEAEAGDAGRVRVPVDAEDAALFFGLVVILADDPVCGFRFPVSGGMHGLVESVNAELLPNPYIF